MTSDNFSWRKMLKLIVASEFSNFKHFGFTSLVVAPLIIFIGVPLSLIFSQIEVSPVLILIIISVVFLVTHYLLKKKSKKWQTRYAETIKQHQKKITYNLIIYFGIYWLLAIALVFVMRIL